ncbi:hypothetical protein PHPALM_18143 [Phytophthora palmivora]|uniref:DEK C-terminal domain-containing protein n=1 Tax=Phytophthora palmivora TaxID=4796 RepID=A0A2P4XKH1_9STRA|nr:hypothetical protein PHPALM_18143 [Phytophthora palmivora]
MMEALGDAPPTSVESLVTEDAIVKALREVLPLMDADTATLKVVMQKLAVRFGMEFVDFKAKWRPRIKALLPEMLEMCMGGIGSENESHKAEVDAQEDEEEEEVDLRPSRKRTERTTKKRYTVVDASDEEDDQKDSDASEDEVPKPEEDDDEEDEDDVDVAPVKKRRVMSDKSYTRKRKNKEEPAKQQKMTKQADPPGLASLKELGRAAGILNPQLYKLMKGASSSEAEDILRERLQDANITFQGSYPSSRDISAAKRKHAKEKELEGIDTSLIISGGRSRRGGGERISYKEERISGEEDNAEDEDEDDKEDAEEEDSADSDSDASEASF